MKMPLLLFFAFLSFTTTAFCQDYAYGAVSNQEMEMQNYANDPSAHAVILNEFGKTRIGLVTDEYTRVIFEYHVRIKILDAKGIDNGTIKIPLYHYNDDPDSYEKIEGLEGVTFFRDDKGEIQKMPLEDKKIYPVVETKNWSNYKFAMPAMRPGCVIEYKYKLISPYFQTLHTWYFQDYIPKIHSEYEVHIPAFWRYNISLRGNLKLTKNSVSVEKACYSVNSGVVAADCSVFVYDMDKVPAFVNEEFMTSPENFRAGVHFEESDRTDSNNEVKFKLTKEWSDVEYILKTDSYFGSQLKKKSLFKDRLVPVISDKTDPLDKAKAVYAYFQHNFKWTQLDGFEADKGVSRTLDSHSGNVGDINISLIAALNAAGLNANPVLLSTRENGQVSSLYPVINDFNYVIAKVDIDAKTYFLDATDPLLSFGMLPLRCLNGKGRVFKQTGGSDWVELNTFQKEKSIKTLDFNLAADGIMKGIYINYATSYDAYKKRIAIKKFNSIDEYVEDFNSKSPIIKVKKAEITNLDSLDQPLIEKYELEINIVDKLNGSDLAFKPFFWDRLEVNPFKLNERLYPVDMGMPSDERMILTVHIPDGYVVDNPPKVVTTGLSDNAVKFVTNYEPGDKSFTFSHIIQLNKPVYDAGEYEYLKEFFNKIILSEKTEIVFKKK